MSYIAYTITSGGQSYQCLGDDEAIQYDQGGNGLAPHVMLLCEWMYVVGSNPQGRTGHVLAAAAGTKFIMQIIPDEDVPAYHVVRVILLEGSSVTVSALNGSNPHTITQTGTYLDAQVNTSTQTIISWDGPNTFDPENTPGSEGLLDEVNAAKQLLGVP